MHRPAVGDLIDGERGEPTCVVAGRVAAARALARSRQGMLNAALVGPDLDTYAPLHAAARHVLRGEMERGRLTGRGYHRIRRVARTIADLDGVDGELSEAHVQLALSMRAQLRPSMASGEVA